MLLAHCHHSYWGARHLQGATRGHTHCLPPAPHGPTSRWSRGSVTDPGLACQESPTDSPGDSRRPATPFQAPRYARQTRYLRFPSASRHTAELEAADGKARTRNPGKRPRRPLAPAHGQSIRGGTDIPWPGAVTHGDRRAAARSQGGAGLPVVWRTRPSSPCCWGQRGPLWGRNRRSTNSEPRAPLLTAFLLVMDDV